MNTQERALILNQATQATKSPDPVERLVAARLLMNNLKPMKPTNPEEVKIYSAITDTRRILRLVK